MFEAKTFADHRVGMLEFLLNGVIETVKRSSGENSELAFQLSKVQEQWLYYNVGSRRRHAAELLGIPMQPVLSPTTASLGWINMILRANYGLIEACGNGLHNPDASIPGNDLEKYKEWVATLLQANDAVNEKTLPTFFVDQHNSQHLPVLLVHDFENPKGRFLHLVVLYGEIAVQSIALDHLSPDWSWDKDDWRTELFSYLNNMSTETFMTGLAKALKATRGDDAKLCVPSDYPMMPEELRPLQLQNDLELVQQVARSLNMPYAVVDLVVRDQEVEAEVAQPEGALEDGELINDGNSFGEAANEGTVEDRADSLNLTDGTPVDDAPTQH